MSIEKDISSEYTTTLEQLAIISRKFIEARREIVFPVSSVNVLQNELLAINRIRLQLPDVSKIINVSPLLGLSRQATIAISSISSQYGQLSALQSISKIYNPETFKSIHGSTIMPETLSNMSKISALGSSLSKILNNEKIANISLQENLVESFKLSILAERSLCAVNLANLGSRLELSTRQKQTLMVTMVSLSKSYFNVFRSFENNPVTYASINPTLSKVISTEYFSTVDTLEMISGTDESNSEDKSIRSEIQYENEISLENYLPKVDEGLYKMWKGAIEAYYSNNSDRIRHFTVSIRELITQLIHKLASDQEIKKWTSDSSLFHECRPTRRARLLFLCRHIDNYDFTHFVKKDIETMLSLMDVLQKGTHNIESNFSHGHLVAIKSKAETTLKFLLEIHFTVNN